MRTILFGDHRSPHLHRWARFLQDAGIGVLTVGYGEAAAQDAYRYESLIDRSPAVATKTGKFTSFLADLRFIARQQPDFICVHFLTFRAALLILLASRPAILSCWGSDILIDQQASKGIRRLVRRMALRRARWITCDAEDVKRAILAETPAAESKVQLIYWGVDTRIFRMPEPGGQHARLAAEIRRELGIPAGSTVLLCNRLVSPNYRTAEIVRQFARCIRNPGTRLIVRIHRGSDPSYVAATKAEAAACPKAADGSERILWLERPIADAEMPALYAASDLALHFPASDATPVSMIEALATGCGILCSDALEAYAALEKDYRLSRISLEGLDDAAVAAALTLRAASASSNARAVERIHSRSCTVDAICRLFRHGSEANAQETTP